MRLRGVMAVVFFWLATAALRAETLPIEYVTFMSHGKAVSCAADHDSPAILAADNEARAL